MFITLSAYTSSVGVCRTSRSRPKKPRAKRRIVTKWSRGDPGSVGGLVSGLAAAEEAHEPPEEDDRESDDELPVWASWATSLIVPANPVSSASKLKSGSRDSSFRNGCPDFL